METLNSLQRYFDSNYRSQGVLKQKNKLEIDGNMEFEVLNKPNNNDDDDDDENIEDKSSSHEMKINDNILSEMIVEEIYRRWKINTCGNIDMDNFKSDNQNESYAYGRGMRSIMYHGDFYSIIASPEKCKSLSNGKLSLGDVVMFNYKQNNHLLNKKRNMDLNTTLPKESIIVSESTDEGGFESTEGLLPSSSPTSVTKPPYCLAFYVVIGVSRNRLWLQLLPPELVVFVPLQPSSSSSSSSPLTPTILSTSLSSSNYTRDVDTSVDITDHASALLSIPHVATNAITPILPTVPTSAPITSPIPILSTNYVSHPNQNHSTNMEIMLPDHPSEFLCYTKDSLSLALMTKEIEVIYKYMKLDDLNKNSTSPDLTTKLNEKYPTIFSLGLETYLKLSLPGENNLGIGVKLGYESHLLLSPYLSIHNDYVDSNIDSTGNTNSISRNQLSQIKKADTSNLDLGIDISNEEPSKIIGMNDNVHNLTDVRELIHVLSLFSTKWTPKHDEALLQVVLLS